MLSDIEIAKSVKLRPINDVAAELGLHEDQIENYGRYIAKVTTGAIDKEKFAGHHLILVTAISPTKAGNGKTTVSVSGTWYAEDWQECCGGSQRTFAGSLFWYEGWSCWRWLCSGASYG